MSEPEKGGSQEAEDTQETAEEKQEDTAQSVAPKPSVVEEKPSSRNAQCHDMFEKITDYLNGELAATSEEYQLLQRLNQMTLNKYQDMTALASRLNEVSQRLNDKCMK